MADLLIKGMDMPKNCEKCLYSSWSNFYQIYVCNAIRRDEPVLFDKKQVKSTNTVRSGRADNCPLIPVPPHGRLIDADELAIRVKSQIQSSFCNQHNATLVFAQGLKLFVENAPTVIEASEDGEQDGKL